MKKLEIPRRIFVTAKMNEAQAANPSAFQPSGTYPPARYIEVSSFEKADETTALNYKWVRKGLGLYLIVTGIALISLVMF